MSQNPQMDVLYIQNLGHVLGIFTRNSEPAQIEKDASAFIGDGLHLRGSPPFPPTPPFVVGQDLVIPPALIGIFRTARNWRQIFQPFTLYVSGLPSAPALQTFSGSAPGLSFSSPNLVITVAPGNAGNILVMALDTAGGPPVQFNAQITAAQTTVNVPMTGLVSGDTYNAFVFVPTLPIAITNFTA
jgi:hypothetical protein